MPSVVGRPAADEFPYHYVAYVDRVPETDPVDAMARQIGETAALLARVSDADALKRYAPGKWSVKEVVGHITDAERIFSYRALRFARADVTPLASFDENAFIPAGGFDRRPLPELAAELQDVRRATLSLFRGFDEAAWGRSGTASGKPISVRALAYIIAGHERHHVAILKERYGVR